MYVLFIPLYYSSRINEERGLMVENELKGRLRKVRRKLGRNVMR